MPLRNLLLEEETRECTNQTGKNDESEEFYSDEKGTKSELSLIRPCLKPAKIRQIQPKDAVTHKPFKA